MSLVEDGPAGLVGSRSGTRSGTGEKSLSLGAGERSRGAAGVPEMKICIIKSNNINFHPVEIADIQAILM